MTQEQLKNRIAEIERMTEKMKKAAYSEYVAANAKHKIGEVVSDRTDTIRVERILYSTSITGVSIYYFGPVLTRKGEPRKNGEKRAVFESNIKK